ncbi:MAG: hypothetical protein GTN67_01400 [Hydrotalea flava]|nr:hypothetical protein [Hydrotalea flava]NIM36976.1 hypothetical protein [Hydrotalea flava]NIN02168.1 hypothetical protein [Hydrotalea flava]NIN13821.1 hypothetical protein [Hydrotalea flava]NIO92902.1 hypothetical protein [Hydrotalea flava]
MKPFDEEVEYSQKHDQKVFATGFEKYSPVLQQYRTNEKDLLQVYLSDYTIYKTVATGNNNVALFSGYTDSYCRILKPMLVIKFIATINSNAKGNYPIP